jgi:hypothetical protein
MANDDHRCSEIAQCRSPAITVDPEASPEKRSESGEAADRDERREREIAFHITRQGASALTCRDRNIGWVVLAFSVV